MLSEKSLHTLSFFEGFPSHIFNHFLVASSLLLWSCNSSISDRELSDFVESVSASCDKITSLEGTISNANPLFQITDLSTESSNLVEDTSAYCDVGYINPTEIQISDYIK